MMAKVGLVFVDVPENCTVCPFNYDYVVCAAAEACQDPIDPEIKRRPIGCPIKVYEVRANEKGNEINN